MERATSSILSDARDVIKRTSIPFLLLCTGLFLVWSTTLEEARRQFRADENTLSIHRIRSEKTSSVLALVKRESLGLEHDIQNLGRAVAQSCSDPKAEGCKTARDQLESAQRRQAKLEQRQEELTRGQVQLAQAIRQVRVRLAEKVSFDLGQGIRLPFTLLLAPLAWLVVLGFLLARLGMARAQFWRLVCLAEQQCRLDGKYVGRSGLIDAPFWIGPPPARRRGEPAGVPGEPGGVRGNAVRVKRLLFYAVLVIAALICLRVSWIGIFFENVSLLPDRLLHQIDQPKGTAGHFDISRLLAPATAFVAVVDVLALLWLALPIRRSMRTPMLSSSPLARRELLTVGLGAIAYSVFLSRLSLSGVDAARNRLMTSLRAKMLWYRKRDNRRRQAAASALVPGWYFNARGSAAHLVTFDTYPGPAKRGDKSRNRNKNKVVKNAAGLKPAHLIPVNLLASDLDAPGLWVRKEYALRVSEDAALLGLRNGQVWLAMNLLAFSPYAATERMGVTLRRFDLAAGIAIWLGLEEVLDGVVQAAKRVARNSQHPKVGDMLLARVERWTGPHGLAWRRRRWDSRRPLKWGETLITRAALPALELKAPEGGP
jgi:hypothetical protein